MMKEENLYIEILKFGKENIGRPVTFNALIEYLDKKEIKYERFAATQFFSALFIDENHPSGNSVRHLPEDGKFYIEHEGYFNLLEYEELKSAQRSSFIATIIAIFAVVISIVSTAASIYYSGRSLSTPTIIDESQVQLLSPKSIELSLENLEGQQKKLLQYFESIGEASKTEKTPNKSGDEQ